MADVSTRRTIVRARMGEQHLHRASNGLKQVVAIQVGACSRALVSNLQRDSRALPLHPVDLWADVSFNETRHAIKKRPGRRFNLEWVAERVSAIITSLAVTNYNNNS